MTTIETKGRGMDPMQIISSLGGWVVAIIVAVFQLLPKKGSLENQMIDQQQERITTLESRVDRLEPMLVWYQRRDIAWMRHVAVMMNGAERGEFPPWPEMTGILAEERQQ